MLRRLTKKELVENSIMLACTTCHMTMPASGALVNPETKLVYCSKECGGEEE